MDSNNTQSLADYAYDAAVVAETKNKKKSIKMFARVANAAAGAHGAPRQAGLFGAGAIGDLVQAAPVLRDVLRTPYRLFGKRILDAGCAAILLALLAPLLVLLAALVALDGGSPVFAHRRVGLGGRTFGCLKFRSMVHGAEEELQRILAEDPVLAAQWSRDHKLDPDPRITRFGAFLRKSSLDELPQLWNVLRGEMSLIGPRPVTPAEMVKYGVFARDYESVRPGLSGLWQVSGRNDLTYKERVELDVRYVHSLTLFGDVRIVFGTFISLIQCTGR